MDSDATLPLGELRYKDLEAAYNYNPDFKYNKPFFRLLRTIVSRHPRPMTVLDIGCGSGIGRNKEMQREIGRLADHYWGVEPDEGVVIEDGLFERVERKLLEQADFPPASVDVAYAFMVMEHVRDPAGFLRAIERLLKPGGVFLFASPNARHCFGLVSKWTERLGIDQFLLRRIMSRKDLDHHYPLAYRINTGREIMKHASSAGLVARVIYYESPQALQKYFVGPFKLARLALIAKRRIWRQPTSLLTICALIEKPK